MTKKKQIQDDSTPQKKTNGDRQPSRKPGPEDETGTYPKPYILGVPSAYIGRCFGIFPFMVLHWFLVVFPRQKKSYQNFLPWLVNAGEPPPLFFRKNSSSSKVEKERGPYYTRWVLSFSTEAWLLGERICYTLGCSPFPVLVANHGLFMGSPNLKTRILLVTATS